MLREIMLGGVMLVCVGCNAPHNVAVASANPQIPLVGSEDWLVWVEKKVVTGDGQGHGPDYGSPEWCMVIDHKLFSGGTELTPCSSSWNEKVTEKLKKMSN